MPRYPPPLISRSDARACPALESFHWSAHPRLQPHTWPGSARSGGSAARRKSKTYCFSIVTKTSLHRLWRLSAVSGRCSFARHLPQQVTHGEGGNPVSLAKMEDYFVPAWTTQSDHICDLQAAFLAGVVESDAGGEVLPLQPRDGNPSKSQASSRLS
jgi:hypothetical protein